MGLEVREVCWCEYTTLTIYDMRVRVNPPLCVCGLLKKKGGEHLNLNLTHLLYLYDYV